MKQIAAHALIAILLATLLPGCGTESKEFADSRPRRGTYSMHVDRSNDSIGDGKGRETARLTSNIQSQSDVETKFTGPSESDGKAVELSRR